MTSCEEVIEELRAKLLKGEPFNKTDEHNFKELCELTGWTEEDVRNALVSNKTPSFHKYFTEAQRLELWLKREEAARKLWGAVTALLCNNIKEVCVLEAKSVEPLEDSLVVYAKDLYRYADEFPAEGFERRWEKCIKLFNEVVERKGGLVEEKRAERRRKLREIYKHYWRARDLLEEIEMEIEELVKENDERDFIHYSEDDFAPLRFRRQELELEYKTDKGYYVIVDKNGGIYLCKGDGRVIAER